MQEEILIYKHAALLITSIINSGFIRRINDFIYYHMIKIMRSR